MKRGFYKHIYGGIIIDKNWSFWILLIYLFLINFLSTRST